MSSHVAKPLIYNSTLSRQRSLCVILYRPQELMTNTSLNFVNFVNQVRAEMSVELKQELFRLDAILVEELTHMPGLSSYALLRTSSGAWYNVVLINHDQLRSNLKQGVHHHYAAYQLAPQCYKCIRIHSGTLPGGVHGTALRCSEPDIMHPITLITLAGLFVSTRIRTQETYTSLVKYKL